MPIALHRRYEPQSFQCIEYGVAPSANPANWPREHSNDTCGYLVGTTHWRTNINHDTWDVGSKASQLGYTGLSLTSCAHLCSSDTACYAWCAAVTWWTACLSYSHHAPQTLGYMLLRRTWALIAGNSTCWGMGYFTRAAPSTSIPAGLVVSSIADASVYPGVALTGNTHYSSLEYATERHCKAQCFAEGTICVAWCVVGDPPKNPETTLVAAAHPESF